jgi:flagellar biosynthesis/type III secretory pathway protein FliH
MSDHLTLHPASGGLADLLAALQPRSAAEAAPGPDLDALHEAAWNAGFAAGNAAEVAESAPLRGQLVAAAAALELACRIDPDTLRPVLADLVRSVAEAVLLAELDAGGQVLLPLLDAALATIRPSEPATLRGHPATLAGLAAQLPGMVLTEDASLPADGFVVTGPDFIIDVNLRARLLEITAEIL